MENRIISYLKTSAGFTKMEECTRAPSDLDYIEGAIQWNINSKELISIEEWDLVDQLWAYIVKGLSLVAEGQTFETYFPDQPLLLQFSPIDSNRIKVRVGERSEILNVEDFFDTLCGGARVFFEELRRLVPEWRQSWGGVVKLLNHVEKERVKGEI